MSYQIVKHPHKGFELLLPDLPLGMRACPVANGLWVTRTHFVLSWVQHDQVIRAACTRKCTDLQINEPRRKVRKNALCWIVGRITKASAMLDSLENVSFKPGSSARLPQIYCIASMDTHQRFCLDFL